MWRIMLSSISSRNDKPTCFRATLVLIGGAGVGQMEGIIEVAKTCGRISSIGTSFCLLSGNDFILLATSARSTNSVSGRTFKGLGCSLLHLIFKARKRLLFLIALTVQANEALTSPSGLKVRG